MSEQNTAAPVAAPTITADHAAAQRAQQVIDMCDLAGFPERIAPYLHSERSIAELRAELMRDKATRTQAAAAVATAPSVPDYSDGTRAFSLVNAIRAVKSGNWKDAGYERAVSEAEAKRLGQSIGGTTFLMPTHMGVAATSERTAHTVGTAGNGGNTVFTEPGSLIELLRNRSCLMRMGATVLSGLQGNVAFPRHTAAGTAYWMGESSGTDVTESNTTFDQVSLSPHTLMARQRYSNQLLAQSNINIEAHIRGDLAAIMGLEVDRAGLHGSGASNQPTGLYSISGTNSVTFGGTVTYAKLIEMVTAIAADNADVNELAFAITPETAAKAMQVSRFSSTDTPLYQGTFSEGNLIGYRAVVSNQLSKTLGTGSDHAILVGAWPQFLIGEWGALSVTVDPYTLAGQDDVRIISRLFVDVDVRHAESFRKGATLVP